ncbi:XRE family transcriptional regulator [Streptomyces sp. ICBB 8177]|uniref:helix-turn-helix domain-containing protein n=1 Tax=Streptomyces sp. ICBB 8177 TaxID=563922 RepID=UPI0011B58D9D|nr:XRE family transcriptional regulator [Streptomyces sp. ICBB 8177]
MSTTPPECLRLATELRTLRERAKLSLARLAAESAYSKSSWHRYLNGSALPPWHAVATLCRLADEPESRLRATWELAESAWSRRAAVAPHSPKGPHPQAAASPPVTAQQPAPARRADADPTATGQPAAPAPTLAEGASEGPPRPRPRRHRLAVTLTAIATACVVLTAGAVHEWGALDRPKAPLRTSGFHVGCTGTGCDGRDPGVTLCGVEPQTLLHTLAVGGAGLEVRYNPLCRAAWARMWHTRVGATLSLSSAGRPAQSVTVKDARATDQFVYTDMVAVSSGHTPLKVCLEAAPGSTSTCYPVSPPRP